MTTSPKNETELLHRAKSIAGLTLGELAQELGFSAGNHLCQPCALNSKFRGKLGKFTR